MSSDAHRSFHPVRNILSNGVYYFLIISFFALLVFLIQHSFRYLDDNRLTSWQWAFTDVDLIRIFLFLIIGLIVAYFLSVSSLPERIPAVFLFLASFGVSLFFIPIPEVIIDASRYFTQAKHLELYGIGYFLREWGRGIDAWTDMPLIPFLYGLVFKFLGESRLFIQFFTISLFSMTVVFTYLIGRELWNKDTGFYGGLFLLGMPYLFTQVPLMLVDVPSMFFLTLSIFAFIKALKTDGLWIIASSVATVLAILSKYSILLMLTVFVVIFLVFLEEEHNYRQLLKSRILIRAIMVSLIAGAIIGFIVFFKLDVVTQQLGLLLDYQRAGLKRWGESLLSTFFYQIHPFITIGAIYSLYVAIKKRDMRYLIISWLILLILFLQIRRARYTLIVLPLFSLMASYGLEGFKDKRFKGFFSYTAVVFSIIIALFVYLPFLQKVAFVNLKDAGEFLNSKDVKAIEVITIPSEEQVLNQAVTVPLLDLFYKGNIYYQDTNVSLPFEMIETSPLRFTWEYKTPEYYSQTRQWLYDETALVVIFTMHPIALSDDVVNKLNGFNRVVDFDKKTGFFRYTPFVRIYY